MAIKCRWLAPQSPEAAGFSNVVAKSNVPDIRIAFRRSLLLAEHESLRTGITTNMHFRDSPDISSTCQALEYSLHADLDP